MSRAVESMRASSPRTPVVHLFDGKRLFGANGSQLYDVDAALYAELDALLDDDAALEQRLRSLGIDAPILIDDAPIVSPPVRAISLAVAQTCNLACTYCYAQQGEFGAGPRNMPLETAIAAIDLLPRDEHVNIAFLGGEPLANRVVLRAATEYAKKQLANPAFSITTNGTLLTADDAEFFERHAFAVTISIDGISDTHDALRPTKGGGATFDRIMRRAASLLARQSRPWHARHARVPTTEEWSDGRHAMQVSARVTVTPRNLALRETLDGLVAFGFHSVGFSPMLASPNGSGEIDAESLEAMLDAMIDCGEEFERRVVAGDRYPFANAVNAMREIHRGTHRPYPCGAGAGYLGIAADGDVAACHRFVGDERGAMGSVHGGIDRNAQNEWLGSRHVHRQEPCRSCWARYLCGGGRHPEVIRRRPVACHYVPGWLHFCVRIYGPLRTHRPDGVG